MASQKLKELLNRGIARELQVSVQYMWHHVMAKGIEGTALQDIFKKTAVIEMKHAEQIAERLAYLDGTPTTKPDAIFIGVDIEEMLRMGVKAEEEAIELYRRTIETADVEGDVTTRRLFEDILAKEEEHHDMFSRLLVGMVKLSQPGL